MVQEYLEYVDNNIKPLIEKINMKVSRYGVNLDESLGINEEENTSQAQIVLTNLKDNEEFLQGRRKELEEIHQLSGKIKETTDNMVSQVNRQGEMLNTIEANVDNTRENAAKAKQNIIESNELSKRNNKRLYCLIIIVFLLILAIVGIVLSIAL